MGLKSRHQTTWKLNQLVQWPVVVELVLFVELAALAYIRVSLQALPQANTDFTHDEKFIGNRKFLLESTAGKLIWVVLLVFFLLAL